MISWPTYQRYLRNLMSSTIHASCIFHLTFWKLVILIFLFGLNYPYVCHGHINFNIDFSFCSTTYTLCYSDLCIVAVSWVGTKISVDTDAAKAIVLYKVWFYACIIHTYMYICNSWHLHTKPLEHWYGELIWCVTCMSTWQILKRYNRILVQT